VRFHCCTSGEISDAVKAKGRYVMVNNTRYKTYNSLNHNGNINALLFKVALIHMGGLRRCTITLPTERTAAVTATPLSKPACHFRKRA
jgi:hypothetical protein